MPERFSMAPPPEKLEIYYDAPDGKRYHISGGDLEGAEGIRLANQSLGTMFEDLFESPIDTIYQSTAFEVGGRFGGLRENMFEFALAFNVRATADTPWRINNSRFRKSLNYKQDGKLWVKIVGESTRYLSVRMQKTPKLKVQTDPNERRYGLLLVNFVAAYPRWVEDDWTQTYTTTLNTTSSGTETTHFTAWNPTNNECWMKWFLQAGNTGVVYTLPDFSWGDDRFNRASADASRMIIMPALNNGENVVVDTDDLTMAGQVNSSTDTAVYMRMNGVEFLYPLPAYTEPTQIPVQIKGALPGNQIQLRCPRTWSSPWGLE